MPLVDLEFQCGESSLSVRRFSIHEAVSTPFTVSVWARSESPTIDLSAIVGKPAGLRMVEGQAHKSRLWSGLCSFMEQTHAERRDNRQQSTYYLRIVPMVWLMDQARNYRIFQHLSIPDIVDQVLDLRHIDRAWHVDRGQYPKLEYKVQYGETHLAFISRLLEEAGIAYTFPDDGSGAAPVLTMSDALQNNPLRAGTVRYEHNPLSALARGCVSRVRLAEDSRPGAYTLRDYDMRKPSFPLFGEAPKAAAPEDRFEQYHYLPGGFLIHTDGAADTPTADDKGVYRHDQGFGTKRATRGLEAARADRQGVEIEGNLGDLHPGVVFQIEAHPHPDLARRLLVTDSFLEGTPEGEWRQSAHCVFADVPFLPPLVTPRPQALGVQVAKVVGPTSGTWLDQAIHADEFGRVRVQFPWDRYGTSDENSSCWMRVSQGWGGAGYGFINLPRVGHEVLITFLEGDPDRPVVAGRVYNTTQPVPYKLPDYKTVSTWKSDSSPSSEGFNELKFDDYKGEELVYHQAEKNRRLLVKNDETLTVGHDRQQTVQANETETVDGTRTQVTLAERHLMIGAQRIRSIKRDKRQLIGQDEVEYNYGYRQLLVEKSVDVVVQGQRRERDEWDLHRRSLADRKERVGVDHSLLAYEDRQEKVGETFAREAGQEMHLVAGHDAVGEAPDVTVKGPGGFVRINALGVIISGTQVDIQVSGSPGHGHGAHPKPVAKAIEAETKTGAILDAPDPIGMAVVDALKEALANKSGLNPFQSQQAMELVRLALAADVSTPPDGLVLWSGGDIAGAGADQLAAQRTNDPTNPTPSTRLEHTPGAKQLVAAIAAIKPPPDWAVTNSAWRAISRKLAKQASGAVNVVVSYSPLKSDAIFRDEVRMLAANPKVTSITLYKVKTQDKVPIKDASGNMILEPIDLKEVLAKPKKP